VRVDGRGFAELQDQPKVQCVQLEDLDLVVVDAEEERDEDVAFIGVTVLKGDQQIGLDAVHAALDKVLRLDLDQEVARLS